MSGQKFTGFAGLPLSRRAVRVLKDRGIFAHSLVSIEHQELAQRYVVRGLESGGSAGDVGRYVSFAGDDDEPLEFLHPGGRGQAGCRRSGEEGGAYNRRDDGARSRRVLRHSPAET